MKFIEGICTTVDDLFTFENRNYNH